ncbi:MAG: LOG family protein [Planctomycetota bacterium]|nr:LOG family protein [Planctomycetota bacterium]
MYAAPQTPDGRIVAVQPTSEGAYRIDLAFPVGPELRQMVQGREEELIFAARSRLARLGIDIVPTGSLAWDGDHLGLSADVRATVKSYGVQPLLGSVLLPGVRAGRLVFCPSERRLDSAAIDDALVSNEMQLPAAYSIDHDGRFRVRPEGCVYDLVEALTPATLKSIVTRTDGKDLLNRIQTRRAVDRIVLEPNDGVITSCSMFLHRHYVVLESDDSPLGRHLEAVCLDPVRTRGTNIVLEVATQGDRRIVNPAVSAALYHALPVDAKPKRWFAGADLEPASPKPETEAMAEYDRLVEVFDRLEEPSDTERYSHRLVAFADDVAGLVHGGQPELLWRRPSDGCALAPGADLSSRDVHESMDGADGRVYGSCILDGVERGAGGTLLLGYFPNLVEHTQICAAALAGKIRRSVFRRASYEHGSFLSARDHGRLADYEALGLEVFWCNDERKHVALHVFRGLRGFFMEPRNVARFKAALIFAAYGSAKLIAAEETEKVRKLVENLRAFFGEDIAFMTGGGPGSMQQTTDIAQSLGMLVGASFIETVDQETNQTAEFYQTFQGRSRQARQRWFEVASFHLFFMGGVGTLEEVGLTLTDMKLGVIDLSPLVFFGRHDGETYWRSLQRQFKVMVEAGRAPSWLQEHVLVTDDPDQIAPFYKRTLELG